MKKNYLKSIAFIVCLFMVFAGLSGCKEKADDSTGTPTPEATKEVKQEETKTEETQTQETAEEKPEPLFWQLPNDYEGELEWTEDTSPVTLDMFINYSWFALDWEDSCAKMITEKTGVGINIIKPVTDDNQRLNILISSGDLPDMIAISKGEPEVKVMIDADMILSLDDLIDEYAPKFRGILRDEVLRNYKHDDGKTYMFVDFIEGEDFKNAALETGNLVGANQPMWHIKYMDEIGNPDISSPEKFIAALEQLKELYPDRIGFYPGDGALDKTNESPQLGALGVYFGVYSYYENGDAIEWGVRDSNFVDLMKFLNELQIKGLLTKDPFIDPVEVQEQKIHDENIMSYTWTASDVEGETYVAPFDTYRQIRHGTGWNACLITKDTEHPDRCIKFLEYLYSEEGTADSIWGIEGDTYSGDTVEGPHWHMVDGKPEALAGYYDEKLADWGTVSSQNGLGEYWFACDSLLWNIHLWGGADDRMKELNEAFGPRVEYRPEFADLNPDKSSDEGIIRQKAIDLMIEYVAEIVFSNDQASAMAMYDEFISKLDALGLPQLEAYWTQVYQAKVASMN